MRIPPFEPRSAEPHVWRDVREGFAWLWHHPPVRTLTLTIVTFNVTYGAAWSVLVLYAEEQLGLGPSGSACCPRSSRSAGSPGRSATTGSSAARGSRR